MISKNTNSPFPVNLPAERMCGSWRRRPPLRRDRMSAGLPLCQVVFSNGVASNATRSRTRSGINNGRQDANEPNADLKYIETTKYGLVGADFCELQGRVARPRAYDHSFHGSLTSLAHKSLCGEPVPSGDSANGRFNCSNASGSRTRRA